MMSPTVVNNNDIGQQENINPMDATKVDKAVDQKEDDEQTEASLQQFLRRPSWAMEYSKYSRRKLNTDDSSSCRRNNDNDEDDDTSCSSSIIKSPNGRRSRSRSRRRLNSRSKSPRAGRRPPSISSLSTMTTNTNATTTTSAATTTTTTAETTMSSPTGTRRPRASSRLGRRSVKRVYFEDQSSSTPSFGRRYYPHITIGQYTKEEFKASYVRASDIRWTMERIQDIMDKHAKNTLNGAHSLRGMEKWTPMGLQVSRTNRQDSFYAVLKTQEEYEKGNNKNNAISKEEAIALAYSSVSKRCVKSALRTAKSDAADATKFLSKRISQVPLHHRPSINSINSSTSSIENGNDNDNQGTTSPKIKRVLLRKSCLKKNYTQNPFAKSSSRQSFQATSSNASLAGESTTTNTTTTTVANSSRDSINSSSGGGSKLRPISLSPVSPKPSLSLLSSKRRNSNGSTSSHSSMKLNWKQITSKYDPTDFDNDDGSFFQGSCPQKLDKAWNRMIVSTVCSKTA